VFEFSFVVVVVVVVVVFFLVLSRVILYSSFVRSKIQKIKKSPGKNTHKKEEALKAPRKEEGCFYDDREGQYYWTRFATMRFGLGECI
tara:strand:- start:6705 stop:6968 length:264 start_codon:yes stop_codon:yes gene_type:complete